MSNINEQSNNELHIDTSSDSVINTQENQREQCNLPNVTRHQSFQTAFFNFVRDFRQQNKNLNSTTPNIMRLAGRRWRSMTQTERCPYILEAAAVRNTVRKQKKTRKNASKRRRNRQRTTDSKKRKRHSDTRSNSRSSSKSHSSSGYELHHSSPSLSSQ